MQIGVKVPLVSSSGTSDAGRQQNQSLASASPAVKCGTAGDFSTPGVTAWICCREKRCWPWKVCLSHLSLSSSLWCCFGLFSSCETAGPAKKGGPRGPRPAGDGRENPGARICLTLHIRRMAPPTSGRGSLKRSPLGGGPGAMPRASCNNQAVVERKYMPVGIFPQALQ